MNNIANKIYGKNWMIVPTAFDSLMNSIIVNNKSSNNKKDSSTTGFIADASVTNDEKGDVACIRCEGILVNGATEDECEDYGVYDINMLYESLIEASTDSSISSIVIYINSPGGESSYIPETGRLIKDIDENIKPIYIWVSKQCSSAAYWLASQGRLIGMSESSEIGSVGVYALILDESKKLENEGVKVNAISAGKYKMIGHSFKEMSDEERTILQSDVDKTYEDFKSAINSNRTIDDKYLQGLSYNGQMALVNGFCDVVCDTIEEFIGNVEIETINKKNKDMQKFTKMVKQAASNIVSTVMASPKIETKAEEVEPKNEEPVKQEDEKEVPVKLEHSAHVMCPSCKHKFAVDYDPTYKNTESSYPKDYVEEETEKMEEPAGKIPEEDVDVKDIPKEEKSEDKVEEPKKEDKSKKASVPTPAEWNQAAFGVLPKNKTNAFRDIVEKTFSNINEKQ